MFQGHQKIISTISTVGAIVSIVFLTIIVGSYAVFHEVGDVGSPTPLSPFACAA
jgi:hypothetical protein